MSEVVEKPRFRKRELPFQHRARGRSLCRVWRRARDPGLRHGQVLALGAFHERVAARDQPAEGGEISQHLLLPVRPPLHRRPGAHCVGHRDACPFWPPSRWPTSSAGTARSVPPATRISRRAATTCLISATTMSGGDPPAVSARIYRRPLIPCLRNTRRCPTACSCTWPASRPSPTR